MFRLFSSIRKTFTQRVPPLMNSRASRDIPHFQSVLVALICVLLPVTLPVDNAEVFDLDLPPNPVSSRVSLVTETEPGQPTLYAELAGPGCIRHIWMTDTRREYARRNAIIRIWFDGAEVPHVEAPLRDFFGVMHGKGWYPIDSPFLSVQAKSGYNCYIPMPFSESARIEIETLEREHRVYCMIDWHRYPGAEMAEKRRFCARWRRENPTQRYDEDYFMLDADGPGQLVGFVYGVRLIDNIDRWSHGGADNIYLDGLGEHPSYLRGIGGEDTFGTSYGGSLHTPGTRLNAGMPYYEQIDDGTARPAKLITGYRWFADDQIRFSKSIHLRFGCMKNDICSTVYWYQQGKVRPFFRLPSADHLEIGDDGKEMPRGSFDLPLPNSGEWLVSKLLENGDNAAIRAALTTSLDEEPQVESTEWLKRQALQGFLDFGHVHRPEHRGVGIFHQDKAADASSVLVVEEAVEATLRIGWEGHAVLRVRGEKPIDLGHKANFSAETIRVPLRAGKNAVSIRLSNERGFNHGGWAFSFRATTPDGGVILPQAN